MTNRKWQVRRHERGRWHVISPEGWALAVGSTWADAMESVGHLSRTIGGQVPNAPGLTTRWMPNRSIVHPYLLAVADSDGGTIFLTPRELRPLAVALLAIDKQGEPK